MTPRELVLSCLRQRGSQTQKQLLSLGGPRRRMPLDLITEERAAVYQAIQELLEEGMIDVVNQRTVISQGGAAVGTRTRYRINGGAL